MMKDTLSHTLGDLIADAAARHGERTAIGLVREGAPESWSYAVLYRQARRVAQVLAARGIGPGERVVIWAPNGPWWVAAFFGCILAGVAVVPLDVKSSAEFVRKIAAQTGPRLVVASSTAAGDLERLDLPWVAIDDLHTALPEDNPSWQPVPAQPDDSAEIVFTSGTTGAPKGVLLSHANILSDLEAVEEFIPPRESYHLLSLLPLSHMFEQIAGMFFALFAGARVTFVDSLNPNTIFRAMREGSVTTMTVVPQALALFMSGIEREVKKQGRTRRWEWAHRVAPFLPLNARRLLFRDVHERLGNRLIFVVCGGAYLDPRLAQRWENMGIKVVVGYGMTEASPIVTANSLAERNLRSVGRVIPCNTVRIAPDGEILVRGSNITRGYWQNEEATRAAFEDGWYKTGDLGHVDRDGYLYLKGRKKNMIVLSNGMNVYPEDVENALLEEPGVTDVVVVGREDDGDVALHAILLLQPDSDPAAIVKRANKRLSAHQRVKGYTVWPERDFPRTHTLKPRRDEMLRMLAGRQSQAG